MHYYANPSHGAPKPFEDKGEAIRYLENCIHGGKLVTLEGGELTDSEEIKPNYQYQ